MEQNCGNRFLRFFSTQKLLPLLRYNLIIRWLFNTWAVLPLEISLSIISVLELVLEISYTYILYWIILDSLEFLIVTTRPLIEICFLFL